MRRGNNLFDDLKNTYLIYGFYRRYKARKRLKNIRRNKARIPPYLKKTFEQELNYKLWSTKGARFEACTSGYSAPYCTTIPRQSGSSSLLVNYADFARTIFLSN